MLNALLNDEAGFVVSAELILVSTIAVLGLVVGLSEVSYGINQELEDVGAAFGQVNQGFKYRGATGLKGKFHGSLYNDEWDECDDSCDISCNSAPRPESY